MNEPWLESSAALAILGSLLFAFLTGAVTLRWGRRLPRRGDWLAGIGVLSVILALLLTYRPQVVMNPDEALAALRGWIWPHAEREAIRVGVLRDSLGFTVSLIAAVLSALLILDRGVTDREPRHERIYGAAVIGAAGVALSWLSLTAWLSFGGILLSCFAGFLALGTHWDDEAGASVAARYASERSGGLLLCLFGAFALASSGVDLLMVSQAASVWPPTAYFGGLLMILGLFAQTQPVPISGWLTQPDQGSSVSKIIQAQAFPFLAALAPMIRLAPALQAAGILPTLGWIALASTILISIQGLFQAKWNGALSTWTAAASGLSVCALAFSGPTAAFALALSTLFCSSVLALSGVVGVDPNSKVFYWISATVAAATGAGFAGFVGFSGNLRALADALENPTLAAALILAQFLVALLAWKIIWLLPRKAKRESGAIHWSCQVVPALIALACLGVFWTGSLTAGAIPGGDDEVMTSLLKLFFGNSSDANSARQLTAMPLVLGSTLIALAIAYWSAGRKLDRWQWVQTGLPRFAKFIDSGYGAGLLFGQFIRGTDWSAKKLTTWLDHKLWGRWIPGAATWVLTRLSALMNRSDGSLSNLINRGVYRSTHVPAKMLQLIQSGDIQWYLFFAIGSGIAMLLHFLRF
jgi:hypothetical protein